LIQFILKNVGLNDVTLLTQLSNILRECH